ncbi:hypothetical protein OF820_05985 [Oceanotoga sp. DSM 15011]|jgi:hypothetical protein|uniref:Uncharacterized protein n=1 Tax=Oceanotoga teriensis TaxID=515440 RepID=A0AA45C6S5_9BACT|nr:MULTISPECIES: hypothetical protein [Oceanotoga]MDN5342223.1 hypothetical protein [Oceanotoga sp.]MDO7977247.1 hypothetical protein [Oceanotoga teriensis]PWJ93237.1 hypothetical protein C7380_10866 [Oceanotoga teriensis]UYP01236.1 hypothetical protein OF820_05985 [Oceanotoga sp. DSM 15011]
MPNGDGTGPFGDGRRRNGEKCTGRRKNSLRNENIEFTGRRGKRCSKNGRGWRNINNKEFE